LTPSRRAIKVANHTKEIGLRAPCFWFTTSSPLPPQ
jgi:hypothetical protein